jgi:hypothetical protein
VVPVDRVAPVRENRGEGAGCRTPSRSTYVPRAARCGCAAASDSRQHRGAARVRALEHLDPLGLCPLPEAVGEETAERRPLRVVVAVRGVSDLEPREEYGVELRFECADGHVLAVGRLVDRVERCPAVEQPFGTPLVDRSAGQHAGEHRREMGRPVHDRGIDHLSPTARTSLEQRRQHTDHQVRRPATEVPQQIRRELRPVGNLAQPVQCSGDRDVVEVVPRCLRELAVLAPPGDPGVDQPRVPGQAVVRTETEPLHRTGAHALDQHVGALRDEFAAPPRPRLAASGPWPRSAVPG